MTFRHGNHQNLKEGELAICALEYAARMIGAFASKACAPKLAAWPIENNTYEKTRGQGLLVGATLHGRQAAEHNVVGLGGELVFDGAVFGAA